MGLSVRCGFAFSIWVMFSICQVQCYSSDVNNDPNSAEKKIVILAGPVTGHPKNTHEYEKSSILIKHLLDGSNVKGISTTVVFDGWPVDPSILDTADTIVMISDGGDHKESNHPLYNGERLAQLEKQMKRGCGLVQLHWSTFNPSRFHDRITEWVGGYFDYEKGSAANKWYSAIKHYTQPIRLGEPEHPISNGVKPFRVLEEFYYRIRFRENDPRLKKIVLSKPTGESKEFAVGWAVQRKDGGRGFGFTGGHYYANWWNRDFRKLVLNAIVWTSGAEVPEDGVETKLPEPSKALIITGHNHPAHDWRKTTAALVQVLENDPRVLVDVTEDPEFLGNDQLKQYDVIVMNYSSWERKGLSEKAKKGFTQFLKNGGGLSVIHFANGSWTDTLPNKEADWPEYRTKIVRRVWDHGSGKSGHDAFGNFTVSTTKVAHPITDGLEDFKTQDELYYRQQGPLPIEPLVSAISRDTKKAEPMAWAYQYEKGKVFQTVLGHADVSILMAGNLIRRGTSWAAGLEGLSFDPPVARKLPYLWRSGAQWSPKSSAAKARPKQPKAKKNPQLKLVDGKFGKALDARSGGVLGVNSKWIQEPELTVECWIKMFSKNGFNIIAASETKSSLRHWELYTYSGSGHLSVYMPGIFGEIKSQTDVCDGKWHYVAMTFDKRFVRLFVDGKQVKEQPINIRKHPETKEGFAIGSLVEKTIGCDGLIDELRLTNAIRKIDSVPSEPFAVEEKTVGLWRFDQLDANKKVKDFSKQKNDLATVWKGVAAKQVNSTQTQKPKKITGHWGEDAIGFRWTEKDSEDNRWAFTKHGRFLASTIPLPGGFAEKGLAIKVGDKEEASVCYDLQRLNLMAGWKGGFLEFNQARFGLIRHLKPAGTLLFHNQQGLGWNTTNLKYRGLYSHGKRVLLDYSIGPNRVLESPWLEKEGDTVAISREFSIENLTTDLEFPICSMADAGAGFQSETNGVRIVGVTVGKEVLAAAVISRKGNARLELKKNQIWLKFSKTQPNVSAKVLVWRGAREKQTDFNTIVDRTELTDVPGLKKTAPKTWTEKIVTKGVVGEQSGMGYAVDTIRLPFRNPYHSLFFVTGHDWLENGDMVISTVHGEVWKAKNVDRNLDNVTWHRFATGMYQPLGIRVVNDKVYVLCRDQIVRLHDRDGNDEADFYECFHQQVTTSTGVHDYVCCLETDKDGNFYYIHANDGVVRVSPDGSKKSIVATGFRNPNGMGVRSDGLVTAAPQEGEWTPASAVCEVVKGRHYGYRGPKKPTPDMPLGYDKPLVFLPRLVDNSSGGQFWTESNDWGELKKRLFHLSYGKCTMHLVLRDQVKPESGDEPATTQGAIVTFPFVFESGASRGRMSPHDGQLYVSGLKGWTTAAVRDGSLQRVRFEKEHRNKTFCPTSYKVFANGIELGFTQPIRPDSIRSTGFQVAAWNYRYSKNYGSPEFKLSNPNQQGRDSWRVKSVKLTDGNTKMFLEIPEIRIADQVAIELKVAGDHAKYEGTVYATIKKLRTQSITPGQPFNQALVRFEKNLKQGVWVENGNWKKPNLAYYSKPGKSNLGKSSVRLVTWIKVDQSNTTLQLRVGEGTSGTYRATPLSSEVALLKSTQGKLAESGTTDIEVGPNSRFVKLEVDLNSAVKPVEFRSFWKSPRFREEPIPHANLFVEKKWLDRDPGENDDIKWIHASQIFTDKNCFRCHEVGVEGDSDDYRLANLTAPDLLHIGKRRSRDYVMRKILDPHFEGNDAEMPKLLGSGDKQQAADLLAFLIPASIPEEKEAPSIAKNFETGERLFEQLGCIGCHFLPIDSDKDLYGRVALNYTADKFTYIGLRQFLLNPHRHAPYRKMGNFGLSAAEAERLASFIEKHSAQSVRADAKAPMPKGDAKRGAKLFVEKGCANCHQATENQIESKKFDIAKHDAGCLKTVDESDSLRSPDLGLSKNDAQIMQWFLDQLKTKGDKKDKQSNRLLATHSLAQQSRQVIKQLRCNVCHRTEQQSPNLPEIVFEEGVTGLNPERLPDLSQVGAKLHSDWMQNFLKDGGSRKVRPWLKTRMPGFGGYVPVLAKGLSEEMGIDSSESNPTLKLDPNKVRAGIQLTGQNPGLDCRSCHGVGEHPPRGDDKTQIVLGVNFALVGDRLRQEYYQRWMHDPLRIDPQTKMPKYSADGKTTKVVEVLNGDAAKQYDALWQYLISVGKQAK